MKVLIAKVDHILYDGEARSLTVPGAEGEMTVLSEHMPLVTTLAHGVITIRKANQVGQTFPVDSGILEVRRDGATVIL